MKKKRNKVKACCPVSGCQAKRPHASDPLVQILLSRYSEPDKLTAWVFAGMTELRDSISKDLIEGRLFAWYSRLRQPEELYFRMLYLLFFAKDDAVPHILSGAPPNSFADIYAIVNDSIMDGRGEILKPRVNLPLKSYRIIDTLNDGAHVAFPALQTCAMIAQHPEYSIDPNTQYTHLNAYCTRLKYMKDMFEAGKSKEDVLDGIISMHKPAEYWVQKSKEARGIVE